MPTGKQREKLFQEALTVTLMAFTCQREQCSLIQNNRSRGMFSEGAATLIVDTAWAQINWKGAVKEELR